MASADIGSNSKGLVLNNNITTSGGSVALVCSDDIEWSTGGLNVTTSGGAITALAGASFTNSGTTINISGGSAVGGCIFDNTSAGLVTLSSGQTGLGVAANGGNVASGSFRWHWHTSGSLCPLTYGTLTITTGGSLSWTKWEVNIIAGATTATSVPFTVNTSGASGGGGDVTVSAATPTLSSVSISNGALSGTILPARMRQAT